MLRLALTLAFSAIFLWPCHSVAAPGVDAKIREQLKPVAEFILKVIEQQDSTNINVGEFTSDSDVNYGPGFQHLLAEELNALQKGVVTAKSTLTVRGDYDYVDEIGANGRPTKLKIIKLTF